MKRSIALWGVSIAALALLAAGCSSTTGTSPSAAPTTGGESAGDYESALEYVGGTAGAADTSLEPIKIGFINVEGGPASFPEASAAAKAAEGVVNEYLGGVQGHPLEITYCNIVTGDEDAQKCAQQFTNDDSITSIQLGMTLFGTGPIYQTVGTKKPILGFGPFGPQDLGVDNVLFYTASTYSVAPGVVLYAKDTLDAKTIAVVYDEAGGAGPTAQVIASLAEQEGLDVTSIPVTDPSKWTSALVSAGAQTADVVNVVGGPPSCVPAAQAVSQLGITAPTIAMDFCTGSFVKEALGEYPQWTFIGPSVVAAASSSDPNVQAFLAAEAEFNGPDANTAGSAPSIFSQVLDQVRMMNELGVDNLDSAALFDALRDFTGPAFLGVTSLECGAYASFGAPGMCTTAAFATTYEGGDTWSASQEIDPGTLGLPTP